MNRSLLVPCALIACLSACSQPEDPSTPAAAPPSSPAAAVQAPKMPLVEAAATGNVDAVQAHIDAGTDINAQDPYGSTPLLSAVMFGHTEAARKLINAGADPEVANQDGSRPLHVAALMCRKECLQMLLDKGADKEARNSVGATPLVIATAPYETMRPIYDMLDKVLGPMGLVVDHDYLEKTRPEIAKMLGG